MKNTNEVLVNVVKHKLNDNKPITDFNPDFEQGLLS